MLDEYPSSWSVAQRRSQLDEWLAQFDAVRRPTLGRNAQARQAGWLAASLVGT